MSRRRILTTGVLGLAVLGVSLLWSAHARNDRVEQSRLDALPISDALVPADVARGELVARAGGCIACHTDTENGGAIMAGGVRLESPFGTFISPNISSDPLEGIGAYQATAGALKALEYRQSQLRRCETGHKRIWCFFSRSV
jgi:mono/diheme cytochrome c family protein